MTLDIPAERLLILSAVRSRREASDSGRPILPALYAALEAYRCGILAPVINSLLTLFESGTGRDFRAGPPGAAALQEDEGRLLAMLQASDGELHAIEFATPVLRAAMRGAIRSTRIMIRLALDPVGGDRWPPSFVRVAAAG